MVVDIEQIREEEFILFRKAIRKFYKGRQDQYLEGLEKGLNPGRLIQTIQVIKSFVIRMLRSLCPLEAEKS
jgi:hypothetical protein